MQQWDYCTLVGIGPRGSIFGPAYEYERVDMHPDGPHVTSYHKKTQLAAIMAQLGDEGWELITFGDADERDGKRRYWWFKRPR